MHRHRPPTPRLVLAAWAILAALLLYLPHTANAAAAPPQGWGAAELEVAAAYWGASTPPLCATTSVEFDADLSAGASGRATAPTEAGTDCQMWIAPAASIGSLYYQCVAVVHEYGHWLGLEHSADTSSPMAAELNPTIHVRGCAALQPKPKQRRYAK